MQQICFFNKYLKEVPVHEIITMDVNNVLGKGAIGKEQTKVSKPGYCLTGDPWIYFVSSERHWGNEFFQRRYTVKAINAKTGEICSINTWNKKELAHDKVAKCLGVNVI